MAENNIDFEHDYQFILNLIFFINLTLRFHLIPSIHRQNFDISYVYKKKQNKKDWKKKYVEDKNKTPVHYNGGMMQPYGYGYGIMFLP